MTRRSSSPEPPKLAVAAPARAVDPSPTRPSAPLTSEASPSNHAMVNARAHDATGMTAPVRAKMERAFAQDFSSVRVIPSSARATELAARAFTEGSEIHFAPGKWAPETTAGQELLGHELGHVVQQRAGRVRTTTHRTGAALNDDHALEHEARAMGARAAGGGAANTMSLGVPVGNGGASIVQLDDDPDATALKQVKSETVALKAGAVKVLDGMLAKRLAKRQREIKEAIASEKKADRKKLLEADLAKSLDDIIANPDTKGIDPAHRVDIREAASKLSAGRSSSAAADKKWHQFDVIFLSDDVRKTLTEAGLKPADLKAMIARESSDMTQDDQTGDIAGIAQLDAEEEKLAGGKPGDRKKPALAIPLLARTLVLKAKTLRSVLKVIPTGVEWKKFLFAAYNAGPSAVATAQSEAMAAKLSGTNWSDLVNGGDKSPLRKSFDKYFKKDPTPADKYRETTQYVTDILAKQGP